MILAAPIWHDWAKSIVFQWNADGTEFVELNFGGAGKTDAFGAPGDSRTGGHHILGVAETIKRGLPPAFVIAQASAHSNPTLGNEYKVVNWIRAAAVIARVDPVAAGYLKVDAKGNFRLPALRQTGSLDLNEVVLQKLAPRFGFEFADAVRYNTRYRNPALAFVSAERLVAVYDAGGLDAVAAELESVREAGAIR